MRTIASTILLSLLWFAPALTQQAIAEDEPPIVARIALKNKQTWSVQLLGRFYADRILLRKEGEQGTIELPIADIGRMDFKLPAQAGEFLDQYYAGDMDAAAAGLEKTIAPYRDYITDAPGNLVPVVQTLLKSGYHLGRHNESIALADYILSKTTSGPLRANATCIKTLSLLATEKTTEAEKTATELATLANVQNALILYTRASLQMRRDQLSEAQESLAKLITFHSRDFEWMPPALILSAEGYARAGKPKVAEQVIEEIKLNFPETRWVALAEALDIPSLVPQREENGD